MKLDDKLHEIILDPNGGTIHNSIVKVNKGSSYSLPIPKSNRYTKKFNGWYDLDGNKWENEGVYPLDTDAKLTAKWGVKKYIFILWFLFVIFLVIGCILLSLLVRCDGNIIPSSTAGSLVTNSSSPTKKDAFFITSEIVDNGNVVVPDYPVEESESFSITLKPNTGYSVKSYTINGVSHEITDAKKGEPYKVEGLVQKNGGSTVGVTFVANEYTIILNDSSKNMTFVPDTITVTYDQPIEGLPTTHDEVPNYTIEWKDKDSNVYKNGQIWNVADDITLNANYNANLVSVELNAGEHGTLSSEESTMPTKYGDNYEFKEPQPKEGYKFVGWKLADGSSVESSGTWTYSTDNTKTIVTAQWEVGININDTYKFGEYPQTDVTTTLGNALDELVKEDGWTSYNFYASGTTSDFMKWQDVTYNGTKYRGVMITAQRPEETTDANPTKSGSQYSSGYVADAKEIYWFKYEPITWTVKKIINDSSSIQLVSSVALDAQTFYHGYNYDETKKEDKKIKRSPYDDSKTTDYVYDNNYQYSDIRGWLNTTFYNWAFNEEEKNQIKTTDVDNSVSSTTLENNPFTCNDTKDKVFLLSYSEFCSFYKNDTSLKTTGYAKSQGIRMYGISNAYYVLRSPNAYHGINLWTISSNSSLWVPNACATVGVRPSLVISI